MVSPSPSPSVFPSVMAGKGGEGEEGGCKGEEGGNGLTLTLSDGWQGGWGEGGDGLTLTRTLTALSVMY